MIRLARPTGSARASGDLHQYHWLGEFPEFRSLETSHATMVGVAETTQRREESKEKEKEKPNHCFTSGTNATPGFENILGPTYIALIKEQLSPELIFNINECEFRDWEE
jgi:hypothetical protein